MAQFVIPSKSSDSHLFSSGPKELRLHIVDTKTHWSSRPLQRFLAYLYVTAQCDNLRVQRLACVKNLPSPADASMLLCMSTWLTSLTSAAEYAISAWMREPGNRRADGSAARAPQDARVRDPNLTAFISREWSDLTVRHAFTNSKRSVVLLIPLKAELVKLKEAVDGHRQPNRKLASGFEDATLPGSKLEQRIRRSSAG
jgi:hypothetical protein